MTAPARPLFGTVFNSPRRPRCSRRSRPGRRSPRWEPLLAAAIAGATAAAAGCFVPPDQNRPDQSRPDAPAPDAPADLDARVAAALGGDRELAASYAAFYRLLADRLRAGADDSAAAFAAVAGRAARILGLPGKLSGPAGDALGPALNPPSRLTPARRDAAAAALDRLADACERVFR